MTESFDSENDFSRIMMEQADRLFERRLDRAVLDDAERGVWPDRLWAEVEEAGLPLAMVPEEAGGIGLAMADVARLVRRAGYHAVPLPLMETILAAGLWTAAGGTLPDGPLTLASCNPDDRIVLREGALSGTAKRVPWARDAGHILVLALQEDSATQLALVPRMAASVKPERNIAGEPRDAVSFDGVALDTGALRPAPPELGTAGLLTLGALMRAQQMVGAMERALDLAIPYAKERVQFGRPIAQFQAVQHMLALAAEHLAAASAAADAGVEAYGTSRFEFAAAAAKARVGEAAGIVAAHAHQVHGAIGFTHEYSLHFSTRRLWAWRDEFGSEAFWQGRIGHMACLGRGAALWELVSGL